MDNKDEKTFTDLFSSFKEEPEITTETFSDILNNSVNEKQNKDNVTFDSLFDQMSSEEESDNEGNNTSKNEFVYSNDYNINPFMDTAETIQENSGVIEEYISNEPIVETNPFLDKTPKIEETTLETNPFIQEPTVLSNNEINNNANNEINPFMDTAETIQENSGVIEEFISNEPITETNLFLDKTPKIEETTLETNPFIQEPTVLSNNENNNNDNMVNPFMDTAASIKENSGVIEEYISNEPITETNPFFDNQEKSLGQELKNIPPKSISPFFEEEKKTEENPFFQNQLNLVENKVPDNPKGTIDSTKSKHYNVKIVKKKEPLIKLVLGVLSYALFIWLLLIGITLLVYVLDIKIRAAKGDYSSPTFNAYVVLTGSMLPEIEVYDVVVTKKIDASKLKEKDVITFSSADSRFLNTIITHRIIKKNPPSETEGYTFQTKGDNNNVADSALVPENRIFGKVILKIPKLGYLQEFLASRGGWIIVILIPCLTVISYDTVKLIKGLKKKKYKNIKVQK